MSDADAGNNGFKDGTGGLDLLPYALDNLNIQECLVDTVSHLPEEIITEILVRLPVKSLLRFKCVSKPWLSLISSPQFISSHFSISSSIEADGLNLELLFATKTGMKICSLHETNSPTYVYAIEAPVPKTRPIVGIINGLVCLNLKGTDLCVWNPALNKFKHFNFVPQAPPSDHGLLLVYFFSFGYDELNDDYKVVCMQQSSTFYDGDIYADVFIYSLKADSWRRLDQLKIFSLIYPGVFANGKIYYSGYAYPDIGIHLSLDMSSDKFVEVQPPEYDAGKRVIQMVASGGLHFVLCNYSERKKVDLWLLDTRGVEESWCKLFSSPYAVVNDDHFSFYYRVLYISSNGEIVFGNKYGLLVFDWNKKRYRHIKVVVGMTSHWKIAAYVESLVWPNYV